MAKKTKTAQTWSEYISTAETPEERNKRTQEYRDAKLAQAEQSEEMLFENPPMTVKFILGANSLFCKMFKRNKHNNPAIESAKEKSR